jgi:hypothetical protein
MCDAHDCKHTSVDFTRRGLMGVALAGAAALTLPGEARGADAPLAALCVMCIDYRLVTDGVNNFNAVAPGKPGPGQSKYDLVVLAGASLAATSETTFLPTAAGFWQQFGAAWALHKIQKLVVLDHMGCGAYDVQFNGGNRLPPDRELDLHKQQMRRLKAILPQHARAVGAPETMPVEFWLFSDPKFPPVRIEQIHI